jgi:hypothetical protein
MELILEDYQYYPLRANYRMEEVGHVIEKFIRNHLSKYRYTMVRPLFPKMDIASILGNIATFLPPCAP